ncbi:MAG: hypothetical protein ACRDBO_21615 [Lachnospiraceae bacterium]
MKQNNIFKTAVIILLSVCTVCVITYFSVFSAVHTGHNCESHNCPVCRQMQTAQRVIRQLTQVLASFVLFLGAIYILPGQVCRVRPVPVRTLISDKVRLDR